MNRLMLCSGSTRREGWKTLDVAGGDYTARIPPLPQEVMGTIWDEIELIHGITSFYPWEARALLQDIWDCLAPGGVLMLEQPDFTRARERVEWLFGDQTYCNSYHMNKWAYTPGTLMEALVGAGFKGTRISLHSARHHVPERDFRMEAVK